MAEYKSSVEIQTHTAAADLSAHQYNAVMYVAAGQINVGSASTLHNYVGILANKPEAQGRAASVAVDGDFKARAGAAVASYGVPLTPNGSGRLVLSTSGNIVVATALETAAADGNIISVRLQKPYRIGPY